MHWFEGGEKEVTGSKAVPLKTITDSPQRDTAQWRLARRMVAHGRLTHGRLT